jgi:hypothetical protein
VVVGVLKKGLTPSLPVIIFFFVLFIVLSVFSTTSLQPVNYENILYTWLESKCTGVFLSTLVNIICLGIGAALISYYSIRQEAVEKTNYIPSFLYIFFCAITLNNSLVHPSLIANIFILLSLINIIDTYREDRAQSRIFNAAFCSSLAMFFYINSAFFIILFFIALLTLRPFNWREWLVSLLGLAAPIFIYCCICYLVNVPFSNFFSYLGGLFTNFQAPLLSEYFYPLFLCLIILLAACAVKHFSRGLGSKIKTQKNIGLMYWFLILSLVNFFSKNNSAYFPLVASVIPISILLGDYFYYIKQLKVSNTLFFVLLAAGTLLLLMNLNLI